jgi:D-glycero-D-manno-heptose 1,7-bisphosphate phosphatase
LKQAIFLDRDGVLNRAIVRDGKPFPPTSLSELEILDEARIACNLLRDAGFLLVCVTNQPDIARGTDKASNVNLINDVVRDQLKLDAIKVCEHDDKDGCECRKPKPGMLVDAARQFNLDLARSYMIGDRWRDVEAGNSAGCTTIFVDRSYHERRPESPDHVVVSTLDGAQWIISREENLARG